MYGVAAEHYLESPRCAATPATTCRACRHRREDRGGPARPAGRCRPSGPTSTSTATSRRRPGRLGSETGGGGWAPTVLRRLSAPGARERYDFNVRIMSGRDDLDLGLTPDVPGTPGLLPLDPHGSARWWAS